MAFIRQVWALTGKNLRLALLRRKITTPLRALVLPLVFAWFISYAKDLFIPPSYYGIGISAPIKSLPDAFRATGAARDTFVFVNNGFSGGDIGRIIDLLAEPLRQPGKQVEIRSDPADLLNLCRQTLRGVSSCFGAVIFNSSPTQGKGSQWNYTIKLDGTLGQTIDVRYPDQNDASSYAIPLQHAVDFAIASQNSSLDKAALPSAVFQYPYTPLSEQEKEDSIRRGYNKTLINVLGVALFIAVCGILYQSTGFMASEREVGLASLIDSMAPNQRRWQPQAARFLAQHLAYDIIYLPSWVVSAIIFKSGIFTSSSVGWVILFNILAGLSLSSLSILFAAFFKKAQLSGIVAIIVSLIIAIIAQVDDQAGTGVVATLGFLFAPMNYLFGVVVFARWERTLKGVQLTKAPPNNPSNVSLLGILIIFTIQTFLYLILAAIVENILHRPSSKGRTLVKEGDEQSLLASGDSIRMDGFTKVYQPSFFRRMLRRVSRQERSKFTAVDNLSLRVAHGQIAVLLGANGSGKSTSLEAIAGIRAITGGTIHLDANNGIGVAPQGNVLWPDLTVMEHVEVFETVKATGRVNGKSEMMELLRSVDLVEKANARSKTLSGGQQRRLQLALAMAAGSRVCLLDECTSGLDPLNRKKIQQILFNVRGKRSILLTTHYLDEAGIVADHIFLLSQGKLSAQGSPMALTEKYGGGYRLSIENYDGEKPPPIVAGIQPSWLDGVSYAIPDSKTALVVASELEKLGHHDYFIEGPTIESVFLNRALEAKSDDHEDTSPREGRPPMSNSIAPIPDDSSSDTERHKEGAPNVDANNLTSPAPPPSDFLHKGERTSRRRQFLIIFKKRCRIFRRNRLAIIFAVLIPPFTAGLAAIFLRGYVLTLCNQAARSSEFSPDVASHYQGTLLAGSPTGFPLSAIQRIAGQFNSQIGNYAAGLLKNSSATMPMNTTMPFNASRFHLVNSLPEFNDYVLTNYANVTPGGIFNSASPTFAYTGPGIYGSVLVQNVLNQLLTNQTIMTDYQAFSIPWAFSQGNTLQFIVYVGLGLSVFPAFFALYPTAERLTRVRALHFSNGIKSVSLWSAHIAFDGLWVLLISLITVVVIALRTPDAYYAVGYLFPVMVLYGWAAVLAAYNISLFASSQLAAFAFAAAYETLGFLVFFIAYLGVLTFQPANQVDHVVNVAHYTLALLFPSANMTWALFVLLNIFGLACDGDNLATYPGGVSRYGGSILYLVGQILFLFGCLLLRDSRPSLNGLLRFLRIKRRTRNPSPVGLPVDGESAGSSSGVHQASGPSPDVATPLLDVQHVNKTFGKLRAVQDISMAVPRSTTYGLIGVNGAGKSSLISIIRGDLRPDPSRTTEILINSLSVLSQRDLARSHLSVCPQFDALDVLTVSEHLYLYAQVRGLKDKAQIRHNVESILRLTGLSSYEHRMAAKLSGGNKRKLSLGISLIGHPDVLLLDEPSSGMDALAKRRLWKIISLVAPDRAIVLTTHSMEEAERLCGRVGIVRGKMLAEGTLRELRKDYDDGYKLDIGLFSAPRSSESEMRQAQEWLIRESNEKAVVMGEPLMGKLSFRIEKGGILGLLGKLEEEKERTERGEQGLGIASYSLSPTNSLDEIFLRIHEQ